MMLGDLGHRLESPIDHKCFAKLNYHLSFFLLLYMCGSNNFSLDFFSLLGRLETGDWATFSTNGAQGKFWSHTLMCKKEKICV